MSLYKDITEKLNEYDITLNEDPDDGWGDEVTDILEDFFSDVESVAYEIRNGRRGSYAGFGDSIDALAQKLRSISDDALSLASELEGAEINYVSDEDVEDTEDEDESI